MSELRRRTPLPPIRSMAFGAGGSCRTVRSSGWRVRIRARRGPRAARGWQPTARSRPGTDRRPRAAAAVCTHGIRRDVPPSASSPAAGRCGVVETRGAVEVHEDGIRAEQARPHALVLLPGGNRPPRASAGRGLRSPGGRGARRGRRAGLLPLEWAGPRRIHRSRSAGPRNAEASRRTGGRRPGGMRFAWLSLWRWSRCWLWPV